MKKKPRKLQAVSVGGYQTTTPKSDRLRPYPRYTSLRRFKKAFPGPYSSKGWSVWDEIQAHKDANREMAECHWSYKEVYARACWETI